MILGHASASCHDASWNYKDQVYESRLRSCVSFTSVFALAVFLLTSSYIAIFLQKIHICRIKQKTYSFSSTLNNNFIIIIYNNITQTCNRISNMLVITYYLSFSF